MEYYQRVLLAALTPAVAVCVQAQVTTSSLGGQILNESNQPVAGVVVKATHVPSGTTYSAVTNANGRYTIQGMRPGGPYTVAIHYLGYNAEKFENINLELGNMFPLDASLSPKSTDLGEATVVANRKTRTGAGENFTLQKMQNIPTIDRSVASIVKNTPMAVSSKSGGISFVGSNNRYNSFQIDGVVANDVFGLSADGTNGGQTGANPISMDAVQELQVVIAPYDVRQGGFTGGGINVVTKSGTNDFHGSAYSYFNNQSMYGKYSAVRDYAKVPLTDQFERTFGGTLGGPIIKNKLFFFASVENKRKSYPNNIYPGYSEKYISTDVAQQVVDRYYALTGIRDSFGPRNVESHSLGITSRIDWNINETNHLTLRYQHNNSYKDGYAVGATSYFFANSGYRYNNKTNDIVAEWTNRISDSFYNELRASASFVRDHRESPYQGPTVLIQNVYSADNSTRIGLNIGTEYSSAANGLDQNIYTLEDNLSWYLGSHTLTFGTHNEIYRVSNLFIQAANGSWTFDNLNDFLNDKPNRFNYKYTDPSLTGGDTKYSPAIKAGQFGFYAQDKWNATSNFNVTYGLRIDLPAVFNKPTANETFNQYAKSKNLDAQVGVVPSTKLMVSPRLGFNWYLTDDHKTLLRGGTGIFTGRVPFVWLSNAFNSNGVEMKSTTISKSVPGMNNYQQALTDVVNSSATSQKPDIAVVSKKFKYPQVFRSNLALEHTLPGDVKMTLEAIYSKTMNNVFFENLAINQVAKTYAVPGKENSAVPYYNSEKSDYYSIINLKNTNRGYSYALSALFEKTFNFGLDLAASYTFGHSKSVNDGTSSVAYSNWKYNYSRDTNGKGELGYSKFDIPHRVMVRVGWTSPKYLNGWTSTQIGIVYNGSNGGRYSLSMNESEDFNGDGQKGNNLLYIPTKGELALMNFTPTIVKGQVIMDADQNRAAFEKWIESDSYAKNHRGQYAERNSNMTEWEHQIDLHFGQKIYWKNICNFEFTFDIMNFANCLNKKWGAQYSNVYNVSPLMISKMTKGADGNYTPVYQYNNPRLTKSDILSRWHMQLGFRVSF